MTDWIAVTAQLPPEGQVVETKIDDTHSERNHARLKRQGRLWWFADDSMYIYYNPTHWRPIDD